MDAAGLVGIGRPLALKPPTNCLKGLTLKLLRATMTRNLRTEHGRGDAQSDSLVQYQGDSIKLEHGGMNVGTSKNMAPRIGALRVVTASASIRGS